MIGTDPLELSIVRQNQQVSISRSRFYYRPGHESRLNFDLMRMIDEQFMATPW